MTGSRAVAGLVGMALLACAFLLGLAAAERLAVHSGLFYVSLIAAGMLAAAALAALQGLARDDFTVRVWFDETAMRAAIEAAAPEVHRRWELEIGARERGWLAEPVGLSPEQLVATEPALALAKLRLDLETVLRQMASEAQIEFGPLAVGLTAMAEELARRKVLPVGLIRPVRAIAAVANQAIHGAEVPPEVAVSVVRAGAALKRTLCEGTAAGSSREDQQRWEDGPAGGTGKEL